MSSESMKVVIEIGEHEIECECEFDFQPFIPGVLSGPPERCYPDEPEDYDPTKLTYSLLGVEYDISCLLPLLEDDLDSSFNLWKQKISAEEEDYFDDSDDFRDFMDG